MRFTKTRQSPREVSAGVYSTCSARWMSFGSVFEPFWQRELLAAGARRRRRATRLHPSEIMTIVILFQQSHYRTFKAFYTQHVQLHLRAEFPQLVSYNRFVELLPRVRDPAHRLSAHPIRRSAAASASSTRPRSPSAIPPASASIASSASTPGAGRPRWAGFTASNCIWWSTTAASCSPSASLPATSTTASRFPAWSAASSANSLATKGYLSQALAEQLLVTQGLHLITKLRKNMRHVLMPLADKLLLRKRAIIESINDQLKNICQIEHSRHRSPLNFLVHLLAGLIAYCHQPKKPSLVRDLPALRMA